MSKTKQTFRTRCANVFAAIVSAAGLLCTVSPSAHAQAQVSTGSVLNVFAGGKITLGDLANTQAFCNPNFYDSPQVNVVGTNLLGTKQCKNASNSTPTATALITASGGVASRINLPAFQSTSNLLDVNYANSAQVLINNGNTSTTLNGAGQLTVTSNSGGTTTAQTLTLAVQGSTLNLPAGEYARVNLQVNGILHFQAGTVPTRIKQLNLSNCNGSTMEFEPGEYYIENANWQQNCHLKVVPGTGSNNSVKLYFKNAFTLGSGPTCWNFTNSSCGNSMNPAQIQTQAPEKLKVYLYSGNFITAQGAQIAAGLYVDQGDINLTSANNFVFTGDLFAKNISITNGGPTSFLYKPVFTSITGPVTNPPTISLMQPTPPANGNFIAPAGISLNATATAAAGNSLNKVEFYQGAILIGTATTPTTTNGNNYSVSWANVAANSYSITAKATDNKNSATTSAPITVNVINNNAPTVSLTASPANATAPATIILNATATDSDGTVTKVEFLNGATSIATVTQAPYTANWINVAAGNYNVTAKATDNLGATTTSTPVSVAVTANKPKLYEIHTDQRNTPRIITDSSGAIVWRWDSLPFGESLPNEQPNNATNKFTYNLRFPGHYFDSETELMYNYRRSYDPQAGRYVQNNGYQYNNDGGGNNYTPNDSNPTSGPESSIYQIIIKRPDRGMQSPWPPGTAPTLPGTLPALPSPSALDGDDTRERGVRESRNEKENKYYWLYHLVDCHGEIVYVGMTSDPPTRVDAHEETGKIAQYACKECPIVFRLQERILGETATRQAEKNRIGAMRPVFNHQHNPEKGPVNQAKRAAWVKENCCKK